jgi:hypothetical protein
MGLKFKLEFENVQGDACSVNFLYADYEDEPILLYGGARPFVLSEFNTDQDLFKPVRPQQATIEVLASAAGVKMEDFITDNDEDVVVRFDFGEWTGYWYGYLSQEDIQETWIAQNHILTLRADDGIGRLKDIPLSDDGARLVGTFTPFQFIQYAMQTPVVQFLRSRVVSNLYHTSMSSASNTTGIEQCTIDARTFETAPGEFEDSYTVLEKVNRAWSSTLFQWNGDWFVLRLEEMFTSGNLVGFRQNTPVVGQRTGINQRYDISVGVDESVKPVVPEMIKTLQKPSKETTVRFDWVQFDQIFCNQTFQEGVKLREFTILGVEFDAFSVVNWLWEKNVYISPTPVPEDLERWTRYKSNDLPDDDFLVLAPQPSADSWVKSCIVYVQEGDNVQISFQHRNDMPVTTTGDLLAYLVFEDFSGNKYSLNSVTKRWDAFNNFPLASSLAAPRNNDGEEWSTLDVTALDPIPANGFMRLYLVHDWSVLGALFRYFKDLNMTVQPSIQNLRRRLIKGDYDRYTISKEVSKNFDETIYLDDAETNNYKGAIYEDDGITLTNDEWYRRRYNTERYTFKRQHAIARWFMNRSYKTKLDVNLFGLKWNIAGTNYPIGIINTLKFVQDAPTKTYAITNLREVDFMSCIWSASLVEVYDTTVEPDVPGDTDVHTFDFYYE